ncbi:XCL1 protein, partial [Cercotrichas coryphoeus]|nr:XCL1 protein [Cercotrichas coryphoeus]
LWVNISKIFITFSFIYFSLLGSASSQVMRKYRCVTLSTKQLNIQNLINYERHQVPIDAIMFITARGIRICVSPDQKWVQNAMKKIDEKRAAKRK